MAQNKAAKSISMANNLKAKGDERKTMRCPICHTVVAVDGFTTHLPQCGKGRSR